MKIFPAIDIKDKKCVRLVKGDFDNKTEYEMSPVEQAGKYKDHGFKNLHIVDLDGALTGETVNLDIIQEIVSKFDLKIEIGGGVRNFESIQKYIDVGVEKIILGSMITRLIPRNGSILTVLMASGATKCFMHSPNGFISTWFTVIFGVVRRTSISPILTCRANLSLTRSTAD